MSNIATSATPSDKVFQKGVWRPVKRTFANLAASGTTTSVIAAVTSRKIRVLAVFALAGGTATDLTFNSASTAISCKFANAVSGGEVLPYCEAGWFETNSGEALTATTSAGSATGILVLYIEAE